MKKSGFCSFIFSLILIFSFTTVSIFAESLDSERMTLCSLASGSILESAYGFKVGYAPQTRNRKDDLIVVGACIKGNPERIEEYGKLEFIAIENLSDKSIVGFELAWYVELADEPKEIILPTEYKSFLLDSPLKPKEARRVELHLQFEELARKVWENNIRPNEGYYLNLKIIPQISKVKYSNKNDWISLSSFKPAFGSISLTKFAQNNLSELAKVDDGGDTTDQGQPECNELQSGCRRTCIDPPLCQPQCRLTTEWEECYEFGPPPGCCSYAAGENCDPPVICPLLCCTPDRCE